MRTTMSLLSGAMLYLLLCACTAPVVQNQHSPRMTELRGFAKIFGDRTARADFISSCSTEEYQQQVMARASQEGDTADRISRILRDAYGTVSTFKANDTARNRSCSGVPELVLNLQFTYIAIGAQQDSLSRYFCLDVPRLKQGLLCRKLFHNDIIDAALTLSCLNNKQRTSIADLRFQDWEANLCPQDMRTWRTK